jgi:hypothetical protein
MWWEVKVNKPVIAVTHHVGQNFQEQWERTTGM